jgi:hypothetical protein
LHAYDVTTPSRPKLASTIEVGKGEPWEVSRAFASEGAVYLSHKQLGKGVVDDADEAGGGQSAAQADDHKTANRHFLDVIAYEDPSLPDIADVHPNLPGRLVGLSRHGRLLYTVGLDYDLNAGSPASDAPALQASAFDGTAVHLLDTLPLSADLAQPFTVSGETLFLLKPEPTHVWNAEPDVLAFVENPNLTTLSTLTVTDEGKFLKLDEVALAHESNFSLFGNLAVAHGAQSYNICFLGWRGADYWSGGNSRHFHLVDVTNPTHLQSLGTYASDGLIYPDLTNADGDITRGVWVPLGDYGVEFVPLPSK